MGTSSDDWGTFQPSSWRDNKPLTVEDLQKAMERIRRDQFAPAVPATDDARTGGGLIIPGRRKGKAETCLEAHVLLATITRYADGRVIGTCERCGDRVELPREVGDVGGRLRGLIQGLVGELDLQAWTLEEYRALVAELEEVEAEVSECRAMVDLAADMLQQKFDVEEADLRGPTPR